MTEEEQEKVSSRTWYLLHNPVFNPTKSDKIRVVFDAAANNKGQHLNSSLCAGPDMLNVLIGVLLRFRNNNIAMVADVEPIIHQVKVKSLGCESLQFLWGDTPEQNSKVETYQMLVHIFGDTDSLCCRTLLSKEQQGTIQKIIVQWQCKLY